MPVNGGTLTSRIFKYSDVFVAVAVIAMIVMMVVPLPTALLDLLLSFNLTFSLVVLLVTMYTAEPLQFSIFPSLLLVTTLFRLSLNVTSARLVLLNGYAGEVIRTFGSFVVGGNPVVGFIVFLILVVIQFIVITKGAERVAEVAARFTLDAMPGKQMSIDADLNAGTITDKEARARRLAIEREADFYGAMDGASKFVRGDAIAGILIIVIDIIGGFVIGMVQRGMSVTEALSTYTLLTVGEGLITQIPALLVSTATGMIVTRAASEGAMGQDLVAQLLAQPRVLQIAGGVLGLLGLVPGLPKLPFFALAVLIFGLGSYMQRALKVDAAEAEEKARAEAVESEKRPENVLSLLQIDPLEIELGYGLIPLADRTQNGDLAERVAAIRRQMALELGLVVPPIRIMDNMQLRPNTYLIKLRGVQISQGELILGRSLAMNPGVAEEDLEGIQTHEPAFGLPALWITDEQRERAEALGYTVVDPGSVLATHLTEVVRGHAPDLLGRQEVQTLIEAVKQHHPAVVEELIPNLMTLGEVQKVLQNLLREGVSVRDLVSIAESLADHARQTKDPDILTEYARQALYRTITRQYGLDKGPTNVVTVDPELEQVILRSVQRSDQGSYLALDPEVTQRVHASLRDLIEKLTALGRQAIVLCSPIVRLYFRRLTEKALPRLVVLSYNELDSGVEVESIGTVNV
ncbi:MAG: flagellar biosynthesis protein FlhA [Bacillota bacterium]